MTWTQEELPETRYNNAVSYVHGDLDGHAKFDFDESTIKMTVFSRNGDSVSHEDLVEFTQQMFEEKDWPTPALNGTEEVVCGDVV